MTATAGRKPRRSLLLRLLDLLMTLLTAVTAVTMVVTFFVPYVDPGRVWFFPVLGLAAPAVYVVTVVLALYWIIRWRLVGRNHGRAGCRRAFQGVAFLQT